jgi:cytochrome c553
MIRHALILSLLFVVQAHAEPPQQILDGLVQEARRAQQGFTASATRGEQFYRARQTGGDAESCATCHTPDARAHGRHNKTHKDIAPLAPVANKERFTDPAKVEKWFRRNCKEVLGRVCTAPEKADFTAYMLSIK